MNNIFQHFLLFQNRFHLNKILCFTKTRLRKVNNETTSFMLKPYEVSLKLMTKKMQSIL